MNKNYPLCLFSLLIFFSFSLTYGQTSNCSPIPEVNFPGGRVVLSFDGNVHDDDDIIAMGYAAGLWWAAGLKDKVVQIEYNNHVCNIDVQESDGSGVGEGDDSQNMRTTASGLVAQFGYEAEILYDYERRGISSTAKMAAEIEKSTASNPLWIIAGGPMETVWRALEEADGGFGNVTIVSHSTWNQNHTHCSDAHDWNDLKNKYQNRGVFFVENCEGSCSAPDDLNDQNGELSNHPNNWYWMRDSDKEHNRWIYSRNPFATKFDPSDAGMSYYLITGGPFNGGDKTPGTNEFRKLMENPCDRDTAPTVENPTTVTITTPSNNQKFIQGDDVAVNLSTSGSLDIVRHQIFINGSSADVDGATFNGFTKTNIPAGNYTLRAEVTNENGDVAETSVSITVEPKEEERPEDPEEEEPSSGANVFSMLSPEQGGTYTAGENIKVDLEEKPAFVKYQIYVNGTLVDTDGSNFTPYDIENADVGTYDIRAEVTDNSGNKFTKSISVKVHASSQDPDTGDDTDENPPSTPEEEYDIALTIAPGHGETFDPGQDVAITLKGSSSLNIVKYRIFVNGALVDTDGSNFTPHILKAVQTGSYTIKGEITDTAGNTTSETVQISVGRTSEDPKEEEDTNDQEPVKEPLSIISPKDGQRFEVGETITVNLSDSEGVEKYQIFIDNDLVDTDGAFFTPYEMTNAQQGTYSIRAEATYTDGTKKVETVQVGVGSTATSTNGVMEVSMTPTNGSEFNAGDDVSISVEAKNTDKDIVKYRIFVNGNLVDTDGSKFTPHIIENIDGGSHTLQAEVTNEGGEVATKTITISANGFKVVQSTGVILHENQSTAKSIPLRVAPNPVENGVMNVYQEDAQDLIIRNFSGQVIKRLENIDREARVDVSTLAPGVYVLESDNAYFRFVIE